MYKDVLDNALILLNIVVAPPFCLNSAYNIYMITHTRTFQFYDENIMFPLDIVLHLVFNEHNICGQCFVAL